jgi:hypothetical protein
MPSLLTLYFMQNVCLALCLHDYIQLKQNYKSIVYTQQAHPGEGIINGMLTSMLKILYCSILLHSSIYVNYFTLF